jgi:hypothetical protein
MKMRSNVMIAIKEQVRSWNTTQAKAARRLGVTQPRLNDLLHGKIDKFSRSSTPTSGRMTRSSWTWTGGRSAKVRDDRRGRAAELARAIGAREPDRRAVELN